MSQLSELIVKVGAETGEFAAGMKLLNGHIETTAGHVKSAGLEIVKFGEIVTGVVVSVAVFAKALGAGAAALAAHGTATEGAINSYRGLRLALSPTMFTASTVAIGVLLEVTAKLIIATDKYTQSQALAGAAAKRTFEQQLEISKFKDLTGAETLGLKTGQTLDDLVKIKQHLDGLEDPIVKAQAAFRIFGENARTVLPLLNSTLESNVRSAKEMADVFDPQTVQAIHRVSKSFGIFGEAGRAAKQDIVRAFSGLGDELIAAIAVELDKLGPFLRKLSELSSQGPESGALSPFLKAALPTESSIPTIGFFEKLAKSLVPAAQAALNARGGIAEPIREQVEKSKAYMKDFEVSYEHLSDLLVKQTAKVAEFRSAFKLGDNTAAPALNAAVAEMNRLQAAVDAFDTEKLVKIRSIAFFEHSDEGRVAGAVFQKLLSDQQTFYQTIAKLRLGDIVTIEETQKAIERLQAQESFGGGNAADLLRAKITLEKLEQVELDSITQKIADSAKQLDITKISAHDFAAQWPVINTLIDQTNQKFKEMTSTALAIGTSVGFEEFAGTQRGKKLGTLTENIFFGGKDSIEDQKRALNAFQQAVSQATGRIANDMASLLVTGGTLGEMWRRLWQDMAKTIVSSALHKALKEITGSIIDIMLKSNALKSVLASVFGIGVSAASKAGGVAIDAAGGIGGTVASTVGSTGGAVAGAVGSSLTGIVGAVANVATAVSSIISNFQFAAMNKSLDLIVKHTLQTANQLIQGIQPQVNSYLPYLKSIHDRLFEIEKGGLRFGGGAGTVMNFAGGITIEGPDGDEMLKIILRQLKLSNGAG